MYSRAPPAIMGIAPSMKFAKHDPSATHLTLEPHLSRAASLPTSKQFD
jgi:hypothetical protein